jgi:hypothetical protein
LIFDLLWVTGGKLSSNREAVESLQLTSRGVPAAPLPPQAPTDKSNLSKTRTKSNPLLKNMSAENLPMPEGLPEVTGNCWRFVTDPICNIQPFKRFGFFGELGDDVDPSSSWSLDFARVHRFVIVVRSQPCQNS